MSSKSLGDLHARVREYLERSRAAYLLRDHAAMDVVIASPADFAAALGYPVGRIMKTLVCRSRSTGAYAAIVCPMDARVDFKRVAQQLNCGRLETASAADLESVTGYPRGGVSPLGLDDDIPVVVERRALDYETVLVGGGAAGVEVEIAPDELIRITRATVLEFSVAA
jgi:Cys-tRNA(Pro)/Cys-tRNA(Cys) deacylase